MASSWLHGGPVWGLDLVAIARASDDPTVPKRRSPELRPNDHVRGRPQLPTGGEKSPWLRNLPRYGLLRRLRASFDTSKQRYGSPRIHEDLVEQQVRVSRKRVIPLMQEDGLKARARKRFKSTTMSDHDQPVAANLLDRQFTADAPNRRWVGDTTEFVIGESGKLYLAAILDLFLRFVVGWAVSAVNDRHLTLKALDMALKRRCPTAGLLHHSDQGCTYASEDYQRILDTNGITCSMSRRGNCYDNAVMEAFFSSVKGETADRFESCGVAKMELVDYIEVFYNQRRRHSTLGQTSPARFERRANKENADAMENRKERGFPQRPLPFFFCQKEERRTEETT